MRPNSGPHESSSAAGARLSSTSANFQARLCASCDRTDGPPQRLRGAARPATSAMPRAEQTHLNARVHAEAAGGREPVGRVAGQERPPALVALRHLRHARTGAPVKGAALRQWCSQPASQPAPTPGAARQRCLRMQSRMVGSRGMCDARALGCGRTSCASRRERQRCLGVHSPWSDGVNVRLPSHAIAKCSRDQPGLPKALPAHGGRVK